MSIIHHKTELKLVLMPNNSSILLYFFDYLIKKYGNLNQNALENLVIKNPKNERFWVLIILRNCTQKDHCSQPSGQNK
jgi:hypothetical protein